MIGLGLTAPAGGLAPHRWHPADGRNPLVSRCRRSLFACPSGDVTGTTIRSIPEPHRRCSRSSRRNLTRISGSSGAGPSRSAAVSHSSTSSCCGSQLTARSKSLEPYLAPGERLRPGVRPCGRRCTARSSRHTTRRARLPEVERPRITRRDRVRAAVGSPVVGAECRPRTPTRSGCLAACCLSFEQRDLADPAQRFGPPELCGTTHARTLDICHASPAPTPKRFGRSLGQRASRRARRCAPPGPSRSARA